VTNLALRLCPLIVLCAWLPACGDGSSDSESESESLAERVARCESFTGNRLEDCPSDCVVVDAVRVLFSDSECELETDDEGVPLIGYLCVAAEDESASAFGYRGVYRRVEAGDAANDPITPVEPEEVRLLYIHEEMYGWERCTEETSEYCACALQFEILDG
jgi:hypothetical protein